MKLLFIGDVFGEPGKKAILELLPSIRNKYSIDFVVANVENLSKGRGVLPKDLSELFSAGVHVATTGNHAFDQKDHLSIYSQEKRILRPLNYPPKSPGRGYGIYESLAGLQIAVVNLIGRVYMEPANSPFEIIEKALAEIKVQSDIVIVDMHAEATSEAKAMGYFLDGKVAAVLGSHQHVQTADEEILPQGTAYITDAGMTGPQESIIGMKIETALERFTSGIRPKFEVATAKPCLNGVVVEIEENKGLAKSIQRVREYLC